MRAAVVGGTGAHRQLAEEILARLGETTLELIRLEEWVDDFAEHPSLGLVPTEAEIEASHGIGVRLERPDPPSIRERWEIGLLAAALRLRAAEEGLQQVVWLGLGSTEGMAVRSARGSSEPLSAVEVDRLRTDLQAAASAAGAQLRQLDVLRPYGHAWAISLRVHEPHSFLRQRFQPFASAIQSWEVRCAGQRYIEVRDAEPNPALITAYSGVFGVGTTRADVKCCDPIVRLGHGIDAPPPPACPVFG